jgi:hypothetical protein
MDGGANICMTGDLSNIVRVVDIPPMPITVAILEEMVSYDNCCTKWGYTPFSLEDRSMYWQLCFFCTNVVETIILPQAILATSNVFTSWTQTRYKDNQPGSIRFDSLDGLLSMFLHLECHDGLYYCVSNVYIVYSDTLRPTNPLPLLLTVMHIIQQKSLSSLQCPSWYTPATKDKQLESESWLLRLSSPGVKQLDHLPGNATGLPVEFNHHPFHFIDFKEKVKISKQAAKWLAVRTSKDNVNSTWTSGL